ncbi:hypothetical protein ACI2KR_21165 [Pseudomonas luteola]
MLSHESASLLNMDAQVCLTFYYEDREPVGLIA